MPQEQLPRRRMCCVELTQPSTRPLDPLRGLHTALRVTVVGPEEGGGMPHSSPPVCRAARGGWGAQGLGAPSSSPCRPLTRLVAGGPTLGLKNRPLSPPVKKG